MISKLFWLYIPFLALAIQFMIENSFPSDVLAAMHSESGPHEMLQFVVIVLAGIIALKLLFMQHVRDNKYLFGWIFVAFLSCIYVAGEELSWGQHVLQWNTPEYWHAINDQGETNLHNTSSWLDQKPRLVLEIGVLVGGIIIPLLRKFKPSALPETFQSIYPDNRIFPTAIMALVITILDKVDDALPDATIFERASEVEELYLFYFVLLYLVFLRSRILQNQR